MRIRFGVQINLNVQQLQIKMLGQIALEMGKIADMGQKLFVVRIANWCNKTTFRREVDVRVGSWQLRNLHTSQTRPGQIYNWVTKGTGLYGPKKAKYPIRPIRVSALAFSVPNAPRSLAPGQARVSGTRVNVRTKLVMHPGIRPRTQFVGDVSKFYKKVLVSRIHKAARRGLQR